MFDSSLILSNSVDSKGSSNPSSAFEKYFPALYFEIIQGPISVDLLITFHFSTCLLFSLLVVDLKLRIDQACVYVAGYFPIPYCFVIVPNFFIDKTVWYYEDFCFSFVELFLVQAILVLSI